ncbi:Uncharacterised protein [Mycobacteroides abscessus subsp. abscessus]|nr:Uncharacterised protein [Mycobacteroides abscessus subsp. abscessus]
MHPARHVAVTVLMQPGRTVRGVGSHPPIQDHQVVRAGQPRQLVPCITPIQGEQQTHRIGRGHHVTMPAFERLGSEVGMHRTPVAREVQRRNG